MSKYLQLATITTTALFATFLVVPAIAHNHVDDDEARQFKQRHEHRMHKRHEKMEEFMLSKVDTNQDGNIDEKEFMDHAKQRFDLMDANGDGVVTEKERKAAGEAMREKHREAMKAAREAYLESKDMEPKDMESRE